MDKQYTESQALAKNRGEWNEMKWNELQLSVGLAQELCESWDVISTIT